MILSYQILLDPQRIKDPVAGSMDGRSSADLALLSYVHALDASFREKHWANERLGWLFTPQAIFFAVFGAILAVDPKYKQVETVSLLKVIIPSLGIAISLAVLFAVRAAATMHKEWTDRLIAAVQLHSGDGQEVLVPFAFGTGAAGPAKASRLAMQALPWAFITAWSVVLIAQP